MKNKLLNQTYLILEYESKNLCDLQSNLSYGKLVNSKKREYFIDRVGGFNAKLRSKSKF